MKIKVSTFGTSKVQWLRLPRFHCRGHRLDSCLRTTIPHTSGGAAPPASTFYSALECQMGSREQQAGKRGRAGCGGGGEEGAIYQEVISEKGIHRKDAERSGFETDVSRQECVARAQKAGGRGGEAVEWPC